MPNLDASKPSILITPPKGFFSMNLGEFWESREVGWLIGKRQIQIQYKQTVIGFAWAFFRPMVTVMIYVVVFGKIAGIKTDNLPRILFYLSGILLWSIFSGITNKATGSLVSNQRLITKVYFSRLWIPMSTAFAPLLDFLVALLLFIPISIWYVVQDPAIHFELQLLFTPLFLFGVIAFSVGMGVGLSAIQVRYRDVGMLIQFILQALMYMTPVIYPVSILFEKFPNYAWMSFLNPMTGFIHGFRGCFYGQPVLWEYIWISTIVAVVIAVSGIYYFRRVEHQFADII